MDLNSGILWPLSVESTTEFIPCTDAGSMFRVGPQASRFCNEQGEWEDADLTSCTLFEIEQPFLLVWFVIEANEYTDDLEQDFIQSVSILVITIIIFLGGFLQMQMVLDMNGVVYSQVSLQSVYVASVAVTIHVDLPERDQGENIAQLKSFLGTPDNFSSFNAFTVMEGGRGVLDISVAGIFSM